MNPWIAKAVILVASVVMVVIRATHGRRSRGVKILFALRIGAEERMMLEAFGDEYAAYMTRTKLLVPESGDRAGWATSPARLTNLCSQPPSFRPHPADSRRKSFT